MYCRIIPCRAGTFDRDQRECRGCNTGFFSAEKSVECKACPQGFTAAASGAVSCVPCPAGTFEHNQRECRDCIAGLFSVGATDECDACPRGYVAPGNGSASCRICMAGRFEPNDRRTCELCPAGFGSASGGAASCKPCKVGEEVAPVAGSSACVRCRYGTFPSVNGTSCQMSRRGIRASAITIVASAQLLFLLHVAGLLQVRPPPPAIQSPPRVLTSAPPR